MGLKGNFGSDCCSIIRWINCTWPKPKYMDSTSLGKDVKLSYVLSHLAYWDKKHLGFGIPVKN